MTTMASAASGVDVSQALLDVLRAADRPLTLSEIHRDLTAVKVPKGRIVEVLRELIHQQRAFLCSPAGKQDRYWGHDEYQRVMEKAKELLGRAQASLSESDLIKRLTEALPKVATGAKLREFIQRMKGESQLFEHPVKGRSIRLLGTEPFDAANLVQLNKTTIKNLRDTLQKIQNYGGGIDQLLTMIRGELSRAPVVTEANDGEPRDSRESTPQSRNARAEDTVNEIDDLILKGMRDLVPNGEQGTSVSLAELRRNMPSEYQTREVFDRAVLRLAQQGQLQLKTVEQTGESMDLEQQGLVQDESGTNFDRAACLV